MKEVKCQNENAISLQENMKKGRDASTNSKIFSDKRSKGRAPLTSTTNALNQKSNFQSKTTKSTRKDEKKVGSQLGFTVLEDASAGASKSAAVAPPADVSQAGSTSVTKRNAETQTVPPEYPPEAVVADLCSTEAPSEHYWLRLAETRRQALEETLTENQELHQRLEKLEEELELMREVVQKAEDVMASVQEWTEEQESAGTQEQESAGTEEQESAGIQEQESAGTQEQESAGTQEQKSAGAEEQKSAGR